MLNCFGEPINKKPLRPRTEMVSQIKISNAQPRRSFQNLPGYVNFSLHLGNYVLWWSVFGKHAGACVGFFARIVHYQVDIHSFIALGKREREKMQMR